MITVNDLTFCESDFTAVWPELVPHWETHWAETRPEGDARRLDVDLKRYLTLAERGVLKVLVARHSREVVGYYVATVTPAPKAEGLQAQVDSYYLAPSFRGRSGVMLLREGEAMVKRAGANRILMPAKNQGKILERLGYVVAEVIYSRTL